MTLDTLKRSARKVLRIFNIGLVKFDVLSQLIDSTQKFSERSDTFEDAKFLRRLPPEQRTGREPGATRKTRLPSLTDRNDHGQHGNPVLAQCPTPASCLASS